VQDDYLDAFGDPEKFGKQPGGDILVNKKTFLIIRALEVADKIKRKELLLQLQTNNEGKVEKVLQIFRDCKVDQWAQELKSKYLDAALQHLDETAVISTRKKPLEALAHFLIQREH